MTYRPRPLADLPDAGCVDLAHHASAGDLALYIGAGVSVAGPSFVPTSAELIELVNPRLLGELGIHGETDDGAPKDLEIVGDEADAAGHRDALKWILSEEPRFRTGPNFGHLVIAALLREGVLHVLCVNWDRCVESACAELGFIADPTLEDRDRVGRLNAAAYHKLNGCISRPLSVMVTSEEVNRPLPWAADEVRAALGGKMVVFLGLGTVPSYLRRRLQELIERLPDVRAVRVVSRSISSAWQEILGDDLEAASVERSADEYLDDLMRAFVRMHLANSEARAATLARAGDAPGLIVNGIEALRGALYGIDALSAWRWFTRGAVTVPIGEQILGSEPGMRALLAIALLVRDSPVQPSGAGDGFVMKAGLYYLEVCIAPGVPSSEATRRQEAIVERRRGEGRYSEIQRPILHVVVGQYGPLPAQSVLGNIVSSEDGGDLVSGPASGTHRWADAEALIRGEVWDLTA